MLFRFSLYGFLKNQKYYEPFLILALRERGLSFFAIGLLIGFRQVWVNILEIPSGFIADTFGRRRAMIASFAAYILSFLIFAASPWLWSLFAAMFFFAVGEAFRTGTHKAMIFDWLISQGRRDERTQIYGFTRSWSQIGSALSVVLAAAAVVLTENYTAIFWLSVIPYLAGIINFLGYPAYLDGKTALQRRSADRPPADEHAANGQPAGGGAAAPGQDGDSEASGVSDASGALSLVRQFGRVLADSLGSRALRRLFLESAAFRGNTTLIKDYLQPLLQQAALALPFLLALTVERRTAILAALVYAMLYLLSSLASRRAHRFAERSGGTEAAAGRLWIISTLLFLAGGSFILKGWVLAATALMALAAVLQNIWRPIMLSRIDNASDTDSGATVLSIDSQAGSLYVLIFAPLLGLAVDAFGLAAAALFGALSAGIFALAALKPHRR